MSVRNTPMAVQTGRRVCMAPQVGSKGLPVQGPHQFSTLQLLP